jgi:hypothetical protein
LKAKGYMERIHGFPSPQGDKVDKVQSIAPQALVVAVKMGSCGDLRLL